MGTSHVTIGGTTAADRNIISANVIDGVVIDNSSDSNNLVEGNYIGTDAGGTIAEANSRGIIVDAGSTGTTIGGTATGAGNVISGNSTYGIQVDGSTTTGTVVENNTVGTKVGGGSLLNGTAALNITNGAAVQVAGSFNGNVINQGSLSTANGPTTISITGNYTENSSAILNLQVGGPASFDQLSVSGTATLAGTLNVTLLNSFLPDPSESFAIVSAGTRSGTYAAVNIPNYGGRALFSTSYSSTALTLQGTLIVVNSTGDSGQSAHTPQTGNTVNGNPEITLRSAIQYADSLSTTSYIDFNIPTNDANDSSGIWTISPATALPAISEPVLLDASTQPGYSTPVVVLGGAGAGSSAVGLTLAGGNSTVKGLVIDNFSGDGIDLTTSGGDLIAADYIGTNAAGTAAAANGGSGIVIDSSSNTIGGTATGAGNVIGGNSSDGINIQGSGTTGNLVAGNTIGTNAAGTAALPNFDGILITTGAGSTTVGGTSSGARNLISGNNRYGVYLAGASSASVQGNWIGLNAAGTGTLSNASGGVAANGGGSNSTVGGTVAGAGNVISGNGQGFAIDNSGGAPTGLVIQGNLVGTDPTGANDLGNTSYGIFIRKRAGGRDRRHLDGGSQRHLRQRRRRDLPYRLVGNGHRHPGQLHRHQRRRLCGAGQQRRRGSP